jgi:transposase
MSRIRTSSHSIKFSNINKIENLNIFINEYRRISKIFLDYIWNNGYSWIDKENNIKEFYINKNLLNMPSMLTSDIIEKSGIDTFLTGRALKCCMTQIAGIIGSACEKQKKRLYMLNKLKGEGTCRRQRKLLIKRLKQNIPQKPNVDNINPELNSICCNFQQTDKEFDGFLRLTSITKDKMDIRIPIKFNRHSNKLKNHGKLMTSFLISKNKVDFRWELPEIIKRERGIVIGGDQGMKDILTLSDGQITPKVDIHGHSLESILTKMSRKKKGSHEFKRCQEHRKNFINWSLNQLKFDNIKQLNFENIWNIGYKNSTSRYMSSWTNTIIRDKVEKICEDTGVQFVSQSSTYRSQRCSCCGLVRKSNRKGKNYICNSCGLMIDSDFNASKNHEVSLPEIPYEIRKLDLNRKGFYWLDTGLFDLTGRSLQSLLQNELLSF